MRFVAIAFLCLLSLAAASPASAHGIPDSIAVMVSRGDFSQATSALQRYTRSGISPSDSAAAAFEIERMDRIRKDFTLSRETVLHQLARRFGTDAAAQLDRHTRDGSLEMMVIDGTPRYFKNAVSNLFRINPEARAWKEQHEGARPDTTHRFLAHELPRLVKAFKSGKDPSTRFTYRYTLSVRPDVVPAGELIRCWLPYPRRDVDRQTDIRLLGCSDMEHHILSPADAPHSTLYMEQRAEKAKPTVFWIEVSYRYQAAKAPASFMHASAGKPDPLLAAQAEERPPHIVFSPGLRALNSRIAGSERDPSRIARAAFAWISDSIPWASAREYSTIPSLTEYCLKNRHGDCGIQTTLFMTLCRLNGIPTHWQSGWMMHPGDVDMHDWCEISLDGKHWVPADASFGLHNEQQDDDARWFYLGGIDTYRLVVNNDYGAPLVPAKQFPRSETLDFQRGEVEWRGGNLYFDLWSYDMQVEYLGNEE